MWAWQKKPAAAAQVCAAALLTRAPSKTRPGEAGDVREQPFDEIWKTGPVFEKLRTQAYSGSCGTCDYRNGCGGCRARAAYYHDGDILAQDDYCAHGLRCSDEQRS